MLYKVLKEGNVPATLEVGETFRHRTARWLFMSPVFAKTVKPLRILPISVALFILGALGSAYAQLDPALFFYLRYSTYSSSSIVTLYVSNWIGLFLFANLLTYLLYRRSGNDLQLFTCIGLATLPLAVFPYLFIALPIVFPAFGLAELDMIRQYVLIALQIWSVLLVSAAFCFGKGIRLDKAIVVTLAAMYLNIVVLFLLGRFT